MVDFAKGRSMASEENALETRLGRVELKLDTLTDFVAGRATEVDRRFADVDRRFADVDRRFDDVDRRFDAVDRRFVDIEGRFAAVDEAIAEQRQYTEFAFDRLMSEMKTGFSNVDVRFNQLERKLDQFIDTQSKANELVERRLKSLERTQHEH